MANSKNPIVFKQTGQNIKVIVDGEVFSKKVADAEDRKILKERVIAYNAKPLVKEKKGIILFMSADKIEAKREKAAIIKKTPKGPKDSIKAVIEKEPELSKEEQIAAAKKLLEENNYNVHAKQEQRRYRGEH